MYCLWVSLVDLLALLNWKAHPDRVLDILGRLRQISGEEIVKVTFNTTVVLLEHTLCLVQYARRVTVYFVLDYIIQKLKCRHYCTLSWQSCYIFHTFE